MDDDVNGLSRDASAAEDGRMSTVRDATNPALPDEFHNPRHFSAMMDPNSNIGCQAPIDFAVFRAFWYPPSCLTVELLDMRTAPSLASLDNS